MVDVSVILPVYNAEDWLHDTLTSILDQNFPGSVEMSIYNDGSTDRSLDIIDQFRDCFMLKGIKVIVGSNTSGTPLGVGAARNNAIKQSNGKYLCFQDADDIMLPDRILLQYKLVSRYNLVGGYFTRIPDGSTYRYTKWCNTLSLSQLYTQAYTSFGPTLIIPTWFMSRDLYVKYGPFDESGKGTPEDLIFFYKLISKGVSLARVEVPIIQYRYHSNNTSLTVEEKTIWKLRVDAIQEHVLSKWMTFTIWNAGRQGRRLYRSLKKENQNKVVCFCDVDVNKIKKGFYVYEDSKELVKPRVKIVHFKDAPPPFLICIKWGLTGGEFEKNLLSLNLVEGKDYYNFS